MNKRQNTTKKSTAKKQASDYASKSTFKLAFNHELKLPLGSFLIVLAVFLSLFIAGCSGNSTPKIVNVYTGTTGISAQFSTNNPPQEVYEDTDMMVYTEVWNKGAYSIEKLNQTPIVVYLGLDPWYFTFDDTHKDILLENLDDRAEIYLEGKSQTWPIGEKTMLPLALLHVNKLDGKIESPTTKISLNACYYYKTFFNQNICVDGDVYDLELKPLCKNKKVYTFSGQGAPVIISQVDVDMVPIGIEPGTAVSSAPVLDPKTGQLVEIRQESQDTQSVIVRPSFRIYFKNVDTGLIVANTPGSNPCLGGSRNGDTIRIIVRLGNTELICAKPDIKLYAKEGSVRCSLPTNSDAGLPFTSNRNYELPLSVEAEYFYMTTTSREIKISRLA
jgi:hypothetical protein